MSESKEKVYYLHTIEDRPAYFSEDDGQIVYAENERWKDRIGKQYLRKNLRQIRRDQQTTRRNRLAWWGGDLARAEAGKYGYVRVTVPA